MSATVTLSSKGQLVLPKAIRQQQHWSAGTRIIVEETKDGVILKAAPLFAPTTLDQVAGCLAYKGPAKSIEDMDAAVFAEAVRQNPRPKRKP